MTMTFCSLEKPFPPRAGGPDEVDDERRDIGLWFPKPVSEAGFAWDLLCGADGRHGASALESQHVSVNIDPSDRTCNPYPVPTGTGYDQTKVVTTTRYWRATGRTAG